MGVHFLEIINLFTTRELAIGTWILVVLCYLGLNKQIRISTKHFLQCLFSPIFIIVYIILTIYFLAITFILDKSNLWNVSLIKDSIFWFVFSGVALCIQNKDFESIKNTFIKNLKASILLESVINTYTFDFGIELLLVPLISILVMLNAYLVTQEKYKSVKNLTDNILIFIGILTLLYFLYELYINFAKCFRI